MPVRVVMLVSRCVVSLCSWLHCHAGAAPKHVHESRKMVRHCHAGVATMDVGVVFLYVVVFNMMVHVNTNADV